MTFATIDRPTASNSDRRFEIGDRVQANYECLGERIQEELIVIGRIWLDEAAIIHLDLQSYAVPGWNYLCHSVYCGYGNGIFSQEVLTRVR